MTSRPAIVINFASRDYRLFFRVSAGLLAVSAVLAILIAVMLWAVFSSRADISDMDRKVKELAAADEQARLVLLEREQLVKDLAAMSGLLEARRFSWTRLLTNIETIFPVGAALKSMEYHPGDRAVALDGVALSPEALRNLMVGLEKSPSFKDPLLKHQSVDKGSISFNVVALYQEHKAAGVAQVSARAQGE